MKAAHLGQRYDVAEFGRLYRPRFRGVLGQRKVGPRLVVIGKVFAEQVPKVLIAEDDHVVEEISSKGTDHPLYVRVGASCRMHRMGADHRDVFG